MIRSLIDFISLYYMAGTITWALSIHHAQKCVLSQCKTCSCYVSFWYRCELYRTNTNYCTLDSLQEGESEARSKRRKRAERELNWWRPICLAIIVHTTNTNKRQGKTVKSQDKTRQSQGRSRTRTRTRTSLQDKVEEGKKKKRWNGKINPLER